MYFWFEAAPFCCSLSGCRQSKAFWYDLFTEFPSIISTRGTGFHPLSGQRTCNYDLKHIKRGRSFLLLFCFQYYKLEEIGGEGKKREPSGLTYCKVDSNERIFPFFPLDHSRILASITCITWNCTITASWEIWEQHHL